MSITYNGIDYPTRNIFLRLYGQILISTTELNDALVDCCGAYRSKEANRVDEQICYFVKPDEIFMEEGKLKRLIEFELDVESGMRS